MLCQDAMKVEQTCWRQQVSDFSCSHLFGKLWSPTFLSFFQTWC